MLICRAEQPGYDRVVAERFVKTLESRGICQLNPLLEEFNLVCNVTKGLHRLLLDRMQIEDGLRFTARFVQFRVTGYFVADSTYLGVQVDEGAHE